MPRNRFEPDDIASRVHANILIKLINALISERCGSCVNQVTHLSNVKQRQPTSMCDNFGHPHDVTTPPITYSALPTLEVDHALQVVTCQSMPSHLNSCTFALDRVSAT